MDPTTKPTWWKLPPGVQETAIDSFTEVGLVDVPKGSVPANLPGWQVLCFQLHNHGRSVNQRERVEQSSQVQYAHKPLDNVRERLPNPLDICANVAPVSRTFQGRRRLLAFIAFLMAERIERRSRFAI